MTPGVASARSTDTAVVGAGPYGLSVAAHLRARRVDHRIFGIPMESWRRNMPRGMYLKSEGFASSLSSPRGQNALRAYCAQKGLRYADTGVPVPLDTFTAYGHWFQQRFVPHLEATTVSRIRRVNDVFHLTLATGERLHARRVVLAVGISRFAHVPEPLRHLPPELLSHTSAHRDLSGFAGRDVTVIGGGQSALETAALLREHGADARIVMRKPKAVWNPAPVAGQASLYRRVRYPRSGLGGGPRTWFYANKPGLFHYLPPATRVQAVRTALGPAGAWWLRDRVEHRMPLLTGHSLRSAHAANGRVRLRLDTAGGHSPTLLTDHVITGSGYRPDVQALSFLDDALRVRLRTVDRAPAVTRHFESSVPGLYFVGLAAANGFGPVLRFVFGADFTARRVARHLEATARHGS